MYQMIDFWRWILMNYLYEMMPFILKTNNRLFLLNHRNPICEINFKLMDFTLILSTEKLKKIILI